MNDSKKQRKILTLVDAPKPQVSSSKLTTVVKVTKTERSFQMNTPQLIKIQELNTDDQISNRGRVANYEVPELMV